MDNSETVKQEVLWPLVEQLEPVDKTPAQEVIGEIHVVDGGGETQMVLSHVDVINAIVGHPVV